MNKNNELLHEDELIIAVEEPKVKKASAKKSKATKAKLDVQGTLIPKNRFKGAFTIIQSEALTDLDRLTMQELVNEVTEATSTYLTTNYHREPIMDGITVKGVRLFLEAASKLSFDQSEAEKLVKTLSHFSTLNYPAESPKDRGQLLLELIKFVETKLPNWIQDGCVAALSSNRGETEANELDKQLFRVFKTLTLKPDTIVSIEDKEDQTVVKVLKKFEHLLKLNAEKRNLDTKSILLTKEGHKKLATLVKYLEFRQSLAGGPALLEHTKLAPKYYSYDLANDDKGIDWEQLHYSAFFYLGESLKRS